jgi:2-dehydropantoate 2-reductase
MKAPDVILISLKTTANAQLGSILDPLVREGSILLVMQNGLGMEEELQALYPHTIVVGAMCFICSQKRNPGRISHLDYGSVTLGVQGGGHEEVLAQLKGDFESSKVPVTLTANLGESRWRKLLWNIPYNGTSVILKADTKQIMDTPSSRRIIRKLMDEVVAGAGSCGYAFEDDAVEKMMAYTDRMIPYEPSMKLDYDQKRLMEIEYMYLRPLAAAKGRGVSLPTIEMLADQLIFIEESWALEGKVWG